MAEKEKLAVLMSMSEIDRNNAVEELPAWLPNSKHMPNYVPDIAIVLRT
jgi:hypothetical protein